MNELEKMFQEWEKKNLFTMLVENLQLFDREYFFKNFLRRSNATPAEGLCVTFLYLATLIQQLVQATGKVS